MQQTISTIYAYTTNINSSTHSMLPFNTVWFECTYYAFVKITGVWCNGKTLLPYYTIFFSSILLDNLTCISNINLIFYKIEHKCKIFVLKAKRIVVTETCLWRSERQRSAVAPTLITASTGINDWNEESNSNPCSL